MPVLSDHEIAKRITENLILRDAAMNQVSRVGPNPVLSYGLSSYGYDLRLGNEFLSLRPNLVGDSASVFQIDPKDFSPDLMEARFIEDHEAISIPPRGFVLGSSKEYVTIPRDCIGICVGKSTYSRCGILTYTTPLEPQWHGNVTIEISNVTPYTALVYAGEGICQILFLKGSEVCDISYSDKQGKYQGQQGVQVAKP